ncbi:MAG: hypothetical protein AAF226_19850, partial [Verrucomicrobiota bacterium]
MKRRNFIQSTVGTAAASSVLAADVKAANKEKPNVIIVHCDEFNFRTIGAYRDTLSDEQAFMWGKKAFCDTPYI